MFAAAISYGRRVTMNSGIYCIGHVIRKTNIIYCSIFEIFNILFRNIEIEILSFKIL